MAQLVHPRDLERTWIERLQQAKTKHGLEPGLLPTLMDKKYPYWREKIPMTEPIIEGWSIERDRFFYKHGIFWRFRKLFGVYSRAGFFDDITVADIC